MAMATAGSGISSDAWAADRLDIKVGLTGANAVAGLQAKAEANTRKKLHDLHREGTLNGRTLSDDGHDPKVLGVTITIEGKDDDDADHDADRYDVHLKLSDGGAPFVIDKSDANDDPKGEELLMHLDEVIAELVEELNKRHE